MNDTSATTTTGQSGASLIPDGVGAITTIHMVLMALVAIAAIAIIIVGMRRAAQRRQAERKVEINARDAGVPIADEAAPEPSPQPSPAPVAPPAAPAAPVPVAIDKPAPARPEPIDTPPIVPAPTDPTPVDPVPFDDEPIAAAAPLDASPATIAAPDPVPVAPVEAVPATDPADTSVTMLKGLGPKLESRLAALGITTVGQLAALSPAEAASLDAQLGPFTGRMARDRWLEQARLLATGDRAGFEAAFGRL